VKALLRAFPSDHADLDRELARSLALVGADEPRLAQAIGATLTASSSPVDDIHYLAVLARLNAEPSNQTRSTISRTLLALDRKISENGLSRDRHWPLRVSELYAELARKDPLLNGRLLSDAEFGRPDHALFAQAPGFDLKRAAQLFWDRSQADSDFQWTPALIELVGGTGEPGSLNELRKQWDNAGLQESIIRVLARHADVVDRAKFVEGLKSPQLATVQLCLDALGKLGHEPESSEVLSLVQLMRRLRGGKDEDKLRERVGESLRLRTGQNLDASDANVWTEWAARAFPEVAARIGAADGVDPAIWTTRLDQISWSSGDSDRGRAIYTKTGCVTCHSGTRAMGPDLRGVTSRFSRNDLFTAIVQPSRDVSPRYQTTLVSTADGKLFQGTIIYEAVDSLLLQTGADTTIRITNNQIADQRVTSNSLMPAGLIDKLSDQELSDLFAYLKTLR
jgi:putative heme-binding domain-containing protein